MSGRFTGFPPDAEQFFTALAGNQERSWFTDNKVRYERDVKAPMAALIEDLAEELARRAIPLTGDAKRGLFRIHRDVRFSKDKAPYKLHAGAVLTRDGRKDTPGLLTNALRDARKSISHPEGLILMGAEDAAGTFFGPAGYVATRTPPVSASVAGVVGVVEGFGLGFVGGGVAGFGPGAGACVS